MPRFNIVPLLSVREKRHYTRTSLKERRGEKTLTQVGEKQLATWLVLGPCFRLQLGGPSKQLRSCLVPCEEELLTI